MGYPQTVSTLERPVHLASPRLRTARGILEAPGCLISVIDAWLGSSFSMSCMFAFFSSPAQFEGIFRNIYEALVVPTRLLLLSSYSTLFLLPI